MKHLSNALLTVSLVFALAYLSSCDQPEVCRKCSAAFAGEKKIKTIERYDDNQELQERYQYFYRDNLIDSITHEMGYIATTRQQQEEGFWWLKVHYPVGECIPSYYVQESADPGPKSIERAYFGINGAAIVNKHLAYYEPDHVAVSSTAEVVYRYNNTGQVVTRHGTDYGFFPYEDIYANQNYYTYTGRNITRVQASQEQVGYDLNMTYDNRKNPFHLQGGVLFFLNQIAYNDMEHLETIALDANNVTQVVYQGTDIASGTLKITYTFTYTYRSDGYPAKVLLHELWQDDLQGTRERNIGTFVFTYY